LEKKKEVMTSKKPAIQSEKEKVRDIGTMKSDLHTKLQAPYFHSDGVKVGQSHISEFIGFFRREPEFDVVQVFLLKGVTMRKPVDSTHFAGRKAAILWTEVPWVKESGRPFLENSFETSRPF